MPGTRQFKPVDRQEPVRLSAQLPADMERELRQLAADTGRSVSDLVREGIGLVLAEAKPRKILR